MRLADAVFTAFSAPPPSGEARVHTIVGSSCKFFDLFWLTGNNRRSTRGLLPGIQFEVRWHEEITSVCMPRRSDPCHVTGANAPRLAHALSSGATLRNAGAILRNAWHIRRFTLF